MSTMAEDPRVTIRLPVADLEALDMFVDAGEFRDRSDAIRAAIKDFLNSRAKVVLENLKVKQQVQAELQAIKALREHAEAVRSTVEKLNRK